MTQHSPPKYQLYQPGFNNLTSCWLPGGWVTVPQQTWEAQRKAHEASYKHVRREIRRDSPPTKTPLKSLTTAQRQAWEYYSGKALLVAFDAEDRLCRIEVALAGTTIKVSDIERLEGLQVPRYLKVYKGVTDQVQGLALPSRLIVENKSDPLDVTACETAEKLRAQEDLFGYSLQAYLDTTLSEKVRGHSLTIALGLLHQQEETILHEEWLAKQQLPRHANLDQERERYSRMRRLLRAAPKGEMAYTASLQERNRAIQERQRRSRGIPCWVIPEFRTDGSHKHCGYVPW